MEAKFLIDEFKKSRNIESLLPYFSEQSKLISEILQVILAKTKYPYEEYGSWLLIHLAKKDEVLISPFYKELVEIILSTNNPSVLRNILCVLKRLEYHDFKESELIDFLFNKLVDKSMPIAVHVYSLYVLFPFIRKYPELKNELHSILSLYNEKCSPAMRVAIRRFKSEF